MFTQLKKLVSSSNPPPYHQVLSRQTYFEENITSAAEVRPKLNQLKSIKFSILHFS